MGLTITATFEEHGIYFAGDTLECHVRFANVRTTQKLIDRSPPSSAFVKGSRSGVGGGGGGGRGHSASRAFAPGLSDGPRSALVKPSGQPPLYPNGPHSADRLAGSDAFFPNLDDTSEYSTHSTPGGNSLLQYSSAANGDVGGIKLQAAPVNPRKSNAAVAESKRTSKASAQSYKRPGLSVFPSLGESTGMPAEVSPRLEATGAYRGPASRRTSVFSGKGPSSACDGWTAQSEHAAGYQGRKSPMPPRDTDGTRQAASLKSQHIGNGRGTEGDRVRIESIGGDAKNQDGGGIFPRLSTSSVLSTPSTSLTSWLPFGGKQQRQQPKTLYSNALNDGTASDAGSGGLLGSLWRNISGGSNPPSRPATRAGTIVGDECMEKLAIGFAEASGSLTLAPSYIKPEQMELLLMHSGTSYGGGGSAKDSAVGGGMGSWVPASSTGHSGPGGSRAQKSIPLLISSPTVLFSELALAPGESQTFSLKIQLPKSLPPSFRGRAARISYDLVIVAKRSMLESSAYVVRIPFRVLASVGQTGGPETFKLERPIRMLPNQSKLTYQELASVSTPRNTSPYLHADTREGEAAAAAAATADVSGMEIHEGASAPTAGDLNSADSKVEEGLCRQLAESAFLRSMLKHVDSDAGAMEGAVPSIEFSEQNSKCGRSSQAESMGEVSKRNIQAICRRRAPVSFSLSQGGGSVASVWLPKRVYQLGDMVTGKIEFHATSIHVYQVSIWLESVEAVGGQFSNYDPGRTEELTRRVHAEHHEFCRGTATMGFALASLPGAAASFASAIVSNTWQLRIELIIGMPDSPTCDLALSAVTPFPPARHHLQSRAASASRHASALPLTPQPQRSGFFSARRHTVSSDNKENGASAHQSVPATPSTPMSATLTPADVKSQPNGLATRLRSPTVSGGNAHQLPSPHIVGRPSMFSHRSGQPPQASSRRPPPQPPAALDTAAASAGDDALSTGWGAKALSAGGSSLPTVGEAGNEPPPPTTPRSAQARQSSEHSMRTIRRRYDIVQSIPTQTLSCTVAVQMHPSLSKAPPSSQKDSYTIDLTKRG